MSSAKKRDAEATKAAILDAAESLFLEKGVADVSLSQLASRAEVTKSLIHHHFGSKENLWKEVKQRFFGGFFDAQVARLKEAEPSAELLREAVVNYFAYLQARPQFTRLNCWMMLEGDEDCKDMDREVITLGVQRVREAQERGEIRADLDPDHILISFLSLVESWFLGQQRWQQSHFQGRSESNRLAALAPDAYLESTLKILFEGISPRKETP